MPADEPARGFELEALLVELTLKNREIRAAEGN